MKNRNDKLDTERFYELTEIEKGDPWYEDPGSMYCALGAIVQPTDNPGSFLVIKVAPSGYLSVSASKESTIFFGDGLTLRPLNKKDQAKLQHVRSQFCAD